MGHASGTALWSAVRCPSAGANESVPGHQGCIFLSCLVAASLAKSEWVYISPIKLSLCPCDVAALSVSALGWSWPTKASTWPMTDGSAPSGAGCSLRLGFARGWACAEIFAKQGSQGTYNHKAAEPKMNLAYRFCIFFFKDCIIIERLTFALHSFLWASDYTVYGAYALNMNESASSTTVLFIK